MKLAERVAVVTGAGRGIGRAIALKFAEEGAAVIVNDIELSSAEATSARIVKAGGRALAARADVRDREDVWKMFKLSAEEFGKIDILVNNAGLRKDAKSSEMTEKDWDAVADTSLKGSFNCSQAAEKYMLKQNYGKIVNISSPLPPAITGKGHVNYVAASTGLYGLTRSLAVELGPHNINVNCIAPDFIDTEMTRSAARSEGLYLEDLKKFAVAAIPLRRLGTVGDVAELALFLVSDEAGFITGQVINIKGGP
jgi:3-oxoacyl-[acyl-carrier protein] reductase